MLIVDDEAATRDGLRSAIDFERLGISTVLEASNGYEGIHIASTSSPNIILSDVRMPRMDGIKMLERVRSFLPGCVFIFMSGYSDKEYLKAAIRLRAVSYVDKPLSELQAEIGEPVSSSYVSSCLIPGGEDGELHYDGFTVYTVKSGDSETVQDVLAD